MITSESFNQHLDRAVKHYSSLFKLPSYSRIMVLSMFVCFAVGLFSTVAFFPSVYGMVNGIFFGFALLILTVLLNYFQKHYLLKGDPVYDLRRVAALSLFCWILWLLFIVMGFVSSIFFGTVWAVRLCLLGFSAVLILRLTVLYVTMSSGITRFLGASVIPSFISLAPFIVLWLGVANFWMVLLFLAYAFGVALASSFIFLLLLNNVGKKTVGFPSLSIFRAFLLNWIADLSEPFEMFLENLGTISDVEVSILYFNGETSDVFIIVPSVHPGPFKNIGSSLLPSMLKAAVEEKLGGVACVLLGLLGHEFDLASQSQAHKIIDRVVEAARFKTYSKETSPFVKVSNDLATACCQIFGETALMSFSLAPNTTEDLPHELGVLIRREAVKRGLKTCIFVNAHNSINGILCQRKALEALEGAAMTCLEKAFSLEKAPFKVGAFTLTPAEFQLKDGMGPGGITVLVIEVAGQRIAYVIFDGNNMISGLREKILSGLKSVGINDGEVFTTDTHAVNAVTLNARGYHPIGEVMNHEKLMEYVNEAARLALARLGKAKVGFCSVKVQGVKVIGREALEKLCMLPDMVIRRAKRVVVPLFATTSLLLMLILLLV